MVIRATFLNQEGEQSCLRNNDTQLLPVKKDYTVSNEYIYNIYNSIQTGSMYLRPQRDWLTTPILIDLALQRLTKPRRDSLLHCSLMDLQYV